MREISHSDTTDIKNPSLEHYKKIKPEGTMTAQEVDDFWKSELKKEAAGNETKNEKDSKEYDDNGVQFRDGNRLLPENEFQVNGYKYETDDKGRIVSAAGKLRLEKECSSYMEYVKRKEGQEYSDNDDQGHLIARRFGGSNRLENLVPMDFKLNRGDYKKMENMFADALAANADVQLKVQPIYEGVSARPTEFRVTYSIDGEKDIVSFKNERTVTT